MMTRKILFGEGVTGKQSASGLETSSAFVAEAHGLTSTIDG
jgi:hypothetical protein